MKCQLNKSCARIRLPRQNHEDLKVNFHVPMIKYNLRLWKGPRRLAWKSGVALSSVVCSSGSYSGLLRIDVTCDEKMVVAFHISIPFAWSVSFLESPIDFRKF